MQKFRKKGVNLEKRAKIQTKMLKFTQKIRKFRQKGENLDKCVVN